MKVVPEEGWPTEYKRFALVKVADGKEKTLTVFTGTLPEALQHFYRYVHPEPRMRRRR